MENVKSGNSIGSIEMPIGYRFCPTDEELVLHYLRRKIVSLPLPADVIPELDVFHSNPWDLPGELKENRYFFCHRKMNVMSKCSSSFASGCGYWKSMERDEKILAPGTNFIIGVKKSFVFYRGKNLRTQWMMEQFCLVGAVNSPCLTQKVMVQVGDWIVCLIYQKNKKPRRNYRRKVNSAGNSEKSRPSKGISSGVQKNWTTGDDNELGDEESMSCSSGITDISSSVLDEEANSYTH